MELTDVLAEVAAESANASVFADRVLEECGRAIGFDVAYHSRPGWNGPYPLIDAVRGVSAMRQ